MLKNVFRKIRTVRIFRERIPSRKISVPVVLIGGALSTEAETGQPLSLLNGWIPVVHLIIRTGCAKARSYANNKNHYGYRMTLDIHRLACRRGNGNKLQSLFSTTPTTSSGGGTTKRAIHSLIMGQLHARLASLTGTVRRQHDRND